MQVCSATLPDLASTAYISVAPRDSFFLCLQTSPIALFVQSFRSIYLALNPFLVCPYPCLPTSRASSPENLSAALHHQLGGLHSVCSCSTSPQASPINALHYSGYLVSYIGQTHEQGLLCLILGQDPTHNHPKYAGSTKPPETTGTDASI
jgi:hypothetical protein